MKSTTLILLALIMTACSPRSRDSNPTPESIKVFGTERGNGTDIMYADKTIAWFLNANKTAKYCIDVSTDYPLSKNILTTYIEDSFKAWAEYTKQPQIKEHFADINDQGHLEPTTLFAEVSCDGAEDLKFVFSKSSPDGNPNSPHLALAVQESYDIANGWSKGYVWVSSKWDMAFKVKGYLLHEIGHVFGVGHVPGTIMTAHLYDVMRSTQTATDIPTIEKLMNTINWTRQLITLNGLSNEISYESDFMPRADSIQSRELTFEKLVGRKPVGKIKSKFVRLPNRANTTLEIIDEVGSSTFTLDTVPALQGTDVCFGEDVFSVYWPKTVFTSTSCAIIETGYLIKDQNTRLLISLDFNNKSFLRINLYETTPNNLSNAETLFDYAPLATSFSE